MKPAALTTIQSGDEVLNRVQKSWSGVLNPIIGRRLSERVAVPSSATAGGDAGQWAADGSYLYVCIASNSWRRVSVSSW